MVKKIAVLGSTGSIGTQTLNVIENLRDNNYDIHVSALAAHSNIELMERQIHGFAPDVAVVYDESKALELKHRLGGIKTEILTGMEGLMTVSAMDGVDTVVNSLVGKIGLAPTLNAIKNGKHIALANKETLVMAGELIMKELSRSSAGMNMIDSEHTAIFQCLKGNEGNAVSKIYLTASGGPFRGKKAYELENVTIQDALNHPNWSMGRKITVDSATLMNKGFEVIEAKWLYNLEPEKIRVLVHPQSIIHSMVEFEDGSIMAQLSETDMRIPIQYALTCPDRVRNNYPKLDFLRRVNPASPASELTFHEPDMVNFPCLRLAFDALQIGGTMAAVLNCANEIAVQYFLDGKIKFTDIPLLIEKAMSSYNVKHDYSLQDVMDAENWTSDFFRAKGDGFRCL